MSVLSTHIARQFISQVQRLGSDILYHSYNAESNTKNIYGETLGTVYSDPIPLRCVVKENPTQEQLEEFGMSSSVKIVFRIPTLDLESNGISPQSQDKISLNGVAYHVEEIGSEGRLNNQSVFRTFGCSKSVYDNGEN